VATTAAYNLGNARLESGDAAGAVEAYKRALRLTPGHQNAKHNLELALAEREKEKNRLRSPKDGNKGDRPDGKESSPQPSKGQGPPEPKPAPAPQGEPERSPEPPKTPQSGQKTGPQGKNGSPNRAPGQPLPGFKDQPEMNAREAAAVLESVENLERQKRRTEALERLKRRSTSGRDW
jgi:Ca-activated chloride channel family protein